MANLKQETLTTLKMRGYHPYDIAWIGGASFKIDPDVFWALADERYDEGCGALQVAEDLQIRMKDGSAFIREHQNGVEWWRWIFPEPPCVRGDLFAVLRSQAVRLGGASASSETLDDLAYLNLTRVERVRGEEVIG